MWLSITTLSGESSDYHWAATALAVGLASFPTIRERFLVMCWLACEKGSPFGDSSGVMYASWKFLLKVAMEAQGRASGKLLMCYRCWLGQLNVSKSIDPLCTSYLNVHAHGKCCLLQTKMKPVEAQKTSGKVWLLIDSLTGISWLACSSHGLGVFGIISVRSHPF